MGEEPGHLLLHYSKSILHPHPTEDEGALSDGAPEIIFYLLCPSRGSILDDGPTGLASSVMHRQSTGLHRVDDANEIGSFQAVITEQWGKKL